MKQGRFIQNILLVTLLTLGGLLTLIPTEKVAAAQVTVRYKEDCGGCGKQVYGEYQFSRWEREGNTLVIYGAGRLIVDGQTDDFTRNVTYLDGYFQQSSYRHFKTTKHAIALGDAGYLPLTNAEVRAGKPAPRPTTQAPKPAPTTPTPKVIDTGYTKLNLNMRTSASPVAKVVKVLPKGTAVKVYEKKRTGWMKVQATVQGKSYTGWVSSFYISKTKPAPAPKVLADAKTKVKTILRSTASSKAKSVYVVPKGAAVKVMQKASTGWYQVTYTVKGKTYSGWVYPSSVTVTKSYNTKVIPMPKKR